MYLKLYKHLWALNRVVYVKKWWIVEAKDEESDRKQTVIVSWERS